MWDWERRKPGGKSVLWDHRGRGDKGPARPQSGEPNGTPIEPLATTSTGQQDPPAPGAAHAAELQGFWTEEDSPPQGYPHRTEIERAFGQEVNAEAHVDARAQQAADALDARAFAAGNRVAFGSNDPDLHTAAHEAAHVLQEGVGVDDADDSALEAHADAAADLTVSGKSAAHLFSPATRTASIGSSTRLHLKKKNEPASASPSKTQNGPGYDQSAAEFILERAPKLMGEIGASLSASLPRRS